MKGIDCNVIRDLLPLYEDDAVSPETAELVREHLADCPDCRQELRKMRAPISLPPSEDEEAVKRFLERRAKIRKKQNAKIVRVVSVLAVLIVCILCYTLIPRSWDSVAGEVGPDRIMGSYMTTVFHVGVADIEHWAIDQEAGSPAIEALMDILRTGSYRAELRNLMNYIPFVPLFQQRSVQGLKSSILLILVKDDQTRVTVQLYETPDYKVDIHVEGDPNTFHYHTDGRSYQALVELIQKYGVQK